MNKEEFHKGVNDWNNHIPLLWLALEATKTGDVLEMGCGDGSTRQLHGYCEANKRVLHSFDTDRGWMDKFKDCENENHRFHHVVNHWEIAQQICPHPSVILIDHAPGERRIVDIKNYYDHIDGIMVLHDTQPPPTGADYGYERIWKYFKYIVHLDAGFNPESPNKDNRTWASAVSNHYDVTKWRGLTFNNGEYVLK